MVKNDIGRGPKNLSVQKPLWGDGIWTVPMSRCYIIKAAEVNSWRGPIIVGKYKCRSARLLPTHTIAVWLAVAGCRSRCRRTLSALLSPRAAMPLALVGLCGLAPSPAASSVAERQAVIKRL